jgi:hypothetical protein
MSDNILIGLGVLTICTIVLWAIKPKKTTYHGNTYSGSTKRELINRGNRDED